MKLIDRFIVACALWALVAVVAAISDVLHFEVLNKLLFDSGPIVTPAITLVFFVIAPYAVRISGLEMDSKGSVARVTPRALLLFAIGIVILGLAVILVPGW